MIWQTWIGAEDTMSMARQCVLAGVCRSTIYAQQKPKPVDESDLLFSRLIDEEYTRHPFYGSRKMVVFLKTAGHDVNRKRVQGLMREMGLAGMAPGPNTSRPHPEHKVYPYLLRGVAIVRPDQVWGTDLTYIRLARGFAYLVAIMDWYSRRVLSWRISNTHGGEILCRLPGGILAPPRQTRDLQQRSRFSIHQRCLHRCPAKRRCRSQYGWSGASIRQHLC